MINLMPPSTKEEIAYARRNVKLLKWAGAIFASTVGAIAIMLLGQLYLSQSVRSHQAQIEEGQERLKIQRIDETQARVGEISGNLKLVVDILKREILFSKVLRQVGAAIPSGAILTELTIEKVQGGIDLTFEARDFQTGSQILVNLQDPNNNVFEKADIEDITCKPTALENEVYPCQVNIRALFGDNSPYLFINEGKRP